VRFVAKLLSLVPLVSGLALLGLGLARYRLPYENERYFDPQTQTVYHLQAAQVYLMSGISLSVIGLLAAMVCFGLFARSRSVNASENRRS
jgi:hypothetical protein